MQELLDRIGWSQAYFAAHTGKSQRTISNWCRGKPEPLAMKYLELICRIIGV